MDHNDADRTVSDLFSQACGDETPGQLFVAGVMNKIARRRRMRTAAGAGVAVLFVGSLLFALPILTTSTNVVASLPLLVIEPFQQLLLSPTGFVASLPIGILLLALSTVRLTDVNS